MNKPSNMPLAAAQDKSWGWQQPDCRGRAAVEFFIDDLHRILQAHIANRLAANDQLEQTQAQVDALLNRYREIDAASNTFTDQSVTLKEGVDRNGITHIVPIFSPQLKQAMVRILGNGQG